VYSVWQELWKWEQVGKQLYQRYQTQSSVYEVAIANYVTMKLNAKSLLTVKFADICKISKGFLTTIRKDKKINVHNFSADTQFQ
jgi:hypothetical protein